MSQLSPTKIEQIKLRSGEIISIPKCELVFNKWMGEQIENDYGGKQIVEFDDERLFVELAVLRILEKEGFSGVWVDSFGKCLRREMPPSKIQYSAIANTASEIFNIINEKDLKGGGCWDVFVWEGRDILFAECKRNKKDSIRESQISWLERCLSLGLKPKNFLFVEWDVKNENDKREV